MSAKPFELAREDMPHYTECPGCTVKKQTIEQLRRLVSESNAKVKKLEKQVEYLLDRATEPPVDKGAKSKKPFVAKSNWNFEPYLTKGKLYIALEHNSPYLTIMDDTGSPHEFHEKHFEAYHAPAKDM